ncbi:MAG: YwaF family protein [Mycoplasmatales bacterium]|nr:YwaF family protein [Mycoplasmatales bacterium]
MSMLVDDKNSNIPREKGFFSVQGNNLEWHAWGAAHVIAIVFALIMAMFIFIFKHQIKNYFKKRMYLLRVIGIVALIFTILNRILVITQDYPFKWEWFPYHLCRLSIFIYAILLTIGKYNLIKYIALWSIIGAIFGLTLINMGPIQDQVTKKWFNRSVGVDNYFWWDYFLAHIFGFIAPMILWTVLSWKMKYKELLISSIGLFFFALIAFIVDWIFDDYSVNFFFLGKSSAFTLPLPSNLAFLSFWEWRMLTYSIVGFSATHLFWLIWILQRKINFNNKNEINLKI